MRCALPPNAAGMAGSSPDGGQLDDPHAVRELARQLDADLLRSARVYM
jgi:hypothetical protein